MNSRKLVDIHYDEYFKKYKEKLFNVTGNEYTLNNIYSEKGKIKLDLTHNVCNSKYIVTQDAFFNRNNRCQNKECKRKRYSERLLRTTEDINKQIYELVGDEYTTHGEYTGLNNDMELTHNVCGNNFKMRISNFIYCGHRCPFCSHISRYKERTKTHEQFVNEVYEIYNNEYTVLGVYTNTRTPILIRHNICGHEWKVLPYNFLLKISQCPICTSVSKGEDRIKKYLLINNIEYIAQKKFNDLHGVNNGLLSYDFYLPKYNLLIEYQGEQHEHSVGIFGGEKQFKIQQEHDTRKRKYAQNHNINLLEIWYFDFNNTENIISDYLAETA